MGAAAQLLGEQLVELVAGALDGLELSRDGLAPPGDSVSFAKVSSSTYADMLRMPRWCRDW